MTHLKDRKKYGGLWKTSEVRNQCDFQRTNLQLLTKIPKKPYYKNPPYGRRFQAMQLAVEMHPPWEKGHKKENYKTLKSLLGQLVPVGHLKKSVNQEKTKIEKAKARPNPRVDCWRDEAYNALKVDLPLGIMHVIGVPNHLNLENRI